MAFCSLAIALQMPQITKTRTAQKGVYGPEVLVTSAGDGRISKETPLLPGERDAAVMMGILCNHRSRFCTKSYLTVEPRNLLRIG
jgi:hypothetical protein